MSTVDPFRAPTDDSFRALWRNQKLLNFKAGLTKGMGYKSLLWERGHKFVYIEAKACQD